jgi:DNA-binding XRE family transcriptional regulator
MPADLRTLRKRLGLTQAELAAALETTRQTISDQERGAVPVRRERMLAVKYLSEHPDELQTGDER